MGVPHHLSHVTTISPEDLSSAMRRDLSYTLERFPFIVRLTGYWSLPPSNILELSTLYYYILR